MKRPPSVTCEPVEIESWDGEKIKAWQFWCKYCKRYHIHSPAPGYRVAHCNLGSPYREEGYILRLTRRKTA